MVAVWSLSDYTTNLQFQTDDPSHFWFFFSLHYRYGQERTSYIYRLVTDSSLERRIYDRQINKQGMSNRVVDEMSPDAHMNSKDMHTLLCLEEDEQVGQIDKATGKNIEVSFLDSNRSQILLTYS